MGTCFKGWIKPTIAAAFENVKASDIAILVNSGYRDPATNRAVGGARYSRHLWGDALDFRVIVKERLVNGDVQPAKMLECDQVNRILSDWPGGLASASMFSHIDGRGSARVSNGRIVAGQHARWSYGF